jgi:hypothetical protein
MFYRACVVERPAIERVLAENSFVSKRLQMGDAAMHQVRLRCARRRKNRESRAGSQRAWLYH